MPKTELHLHLDCSISYDAVRKMNPDISQEYYNQNFISPAKCRTLGEYIKGALEGIKLMQTRKNLSLVTDDLFKQLKKDNVIYAEIRFAPLLHTQGDLNPEEAVSVVEEAVFHAVSGYGIEARLILCTLRHFTAEQSLETVKLVQLFRNSLVAGFDLAGDEAGFPLDNHIAAFEYAMENSIFCTAHAGEARGPESIQEIIKNPAVTRIGHGVRCAEKPELMKIIKERGIHLEICPTSNVQSNVYDEYRDHPVKKLFDYGISAGINTDARTLSHISLSEEYRKLAEVFGWTASDFYAANVNALNAAFLPEQLKLKLKKRFESEMNNI